MKSIEDRRLKRPADEAWQNSGTTRTKRPRKDPCTPSRNPMTDRLTTLPQELFADVLQRLSLTPVENCRLQSTNRRFCDTLRDNAFWRHVSPDRPRHNQPLTALQQQFATTDSLLGHKQTHPAELLYRQFQARTAEGPLSYTRIQQQLLLYFWTQGRPNLFLIDPNSPYDLARAAVPHAHPSYTFGRFGDDASFMQARAARGAEYIQALSPRLRADPEFMHKIINIEPSNYNLAHASFRRDPAFNIPILQQRGRALCLMPESIRGDKQIALTAFEHWNSDTFFPLLQPYLTVAEDLRRDPDIVYACTKLSPSSFLFATEQYPRCHWDKDRRLVTLALKPHVGRDEYMMSGPRIVFSHVHASLRDDDAIGLLAITHEHTNYTLMSERLRMSLDWCAKALALNPRIIYVLAPELRGNPHLIATMPPRTQLQYLYPLQNTIGCDPDRLARLLREPEAQQARCFAKALVKGESVFCQIDASLKDNAQVLRMILDFDGREIGFFPHDRQQDSVMYNYAFNAYLRQLLARHKKQSLRRTKTFSVRKIKPNGCAALGVFVHDVYFAQQLLLRWPECDYLFAPEVRSQPLIRDLSRLGMLLQEEAGKHTTKGTKMSPSRLLSVNLREAPDSYVLHLALGAFYMIRNNWNKAQSPLLRALQLGQANAASRESIVCQRLWKSVSNQCPQRGDYLYRGVMALLRQAYKRVLEQAGLVHQAHVLLS